MGMHFYYKYIIRYVCYNIESSQIKFEIFLMARKLLIRIYR